MNTKNTDVPKHYLTNDAMMDELRKCHKLGKPTAKLSEMFEKIIEGVQRKLFYKNPDVKIDCASTALLICLENWHKFKIEERDRPFPYFTRVAINGLSYAWNKNERRPIHISINAFISNSEEDIT